MKNFCEFAEELKRLRKNLLITQRVTAGWLGVPKSTYNNWEKAKHIPSAKHIDKILLFYDERGLDTSALKKIYSENLK